MSTAAKTSTKAKTKPTKKETNATKKPRAYPSYHEMAKEAILALKERSGSSQFAIAKYIEENQKNLPSNFKKLLLVQLKKLVADGRLVRVKNSYKLPPKTASAAPAPKPVKKPDAKPKTETKKRKAETVKKTKKPVKSAPAKSPAKKKAKTPVKKKAKTPVKKPKSIKSPAKGAKKAKKA